MSLDIFKIIMKSQSLSCNLIWFFRGTKCGKTEMALIELQGELEGRTEANLQSQFIGDLYFKTQFVSNMWLLV